MADLPESNEWIPGVYQLETSDPVLGGPDGIDNLQAKQLASRTRWLKLAIEGLLDGFASVGKALRLATARTISVAGAATGSTSFDGSEDVEINLVLASSGVEAGSYRKVTVNAKGLITGGSNPTTLGGYGITDALAIGQYGLGGIALAADSIDDRSLRGGFYYFGEGATSFANYVGLLNLPYGQAGFAGQLGFVQGGGDVQIVVRSVTNAGAWTQTRTLWHDGNFNPSSKADKATTLAGYGIAAASQTEAEAGSENTKPMTALRVAQSFAKWVGQATESVLGVAKVASQVQVDTGTDDTAMITPKKLRWGFQILKAANGYIVFPSWLGSFVIQWGFQTVGASTATTYNFPLTFPTRCVGILASFGIPAQSTVNSAVLNTSQFQLQNTYTGSQVATWFALGY